MVLARQNTDHTQRPPPQSRKTTSKPVTPYVQGLFPTPNISYMLLLVASQRGVASKHTLWQAQLEHGVGYDT